MSKKKRYVKLNQKSTKEKSDDMQVVTENQTGFSDFLTKHKCKIRKIALSNTTKNSKGQTVLPKNDEWRSQTEWDEHFKEMIDGERN